MCTLVEVSLPAKEQAAEEGGGPAEDGVQVSIHLWRAQTHQGRTGHREPGMAAQILTPENPNKKKKLKNTQSGFYWVFWILKKIVLFYTFYHNFKKKSKCVFFH